MREVIQKIILPDQEKLKDNYKLYYRGEKGVIAEGTDGICLKVPQYSYIEFDTYFNGCSAEKWKKYTDFSDLKLTLTVEGSFVLRLTGYHVDLFEPVKTVYGEYHYDCPEKQTITLDIAYVKEQMAAFEIETESAFVLYGGSYSAEFPETRDINLAISSTTMKKEEYITGNVKALTEDLLLGDREIRDHLFIHVVDNGRTLAREDFPDHPHVYLHPNKNTGGAGGFARGMIECMHQEEDITHVLLMDDDVMIQTESINKTYVLLRHLLPEYQRCFISGAMLYMENICIQKEDIGTVNEKAYFIPRKREFNQAFLWDNLTNEKEYPVGANAYAAWWYCCIPMETIREKGLPMPVFVRGDDAEYGMRCQPGFITMNGICVWHMGFAGKFNVAMDHYQVNRNLLIDQAASGIMEGVDVMTKARHDFREHLLRFDYDSAELALRAIEDFLKGPKFIAQDLGEKILFSNNELVHKMVPLSEFGDPDKLMDDPYTDLPMSKAVKVLYRATYNGQMLYHGAYNEKPEIVPYNAVYTPGRIAFRTKLYAINPVNRTGYMLTRDNKRFAELMKRYREALAKEKKYGAKIREAYRKAFKTFITEKFWRKYLEI